MNRPWRFAPVALLAACGNQQSAKPPFAATDSAGVRVVVTNVPAWGDSTVWTVDSTPTLSIGSADGADPYLLSYMVGTVRRDDGSVIVADRDSRQLRLFDSTGRFVEAKGRRGPGPAEFGGINRVARCGANDIWVDAGSRISIWSMDLVYQREFTVTDMPMWPLICFGGDGLLVKRDIGKDIDEQPANTIVYDSLELMTLDSVGKSRRDLMSIQLWPYMMVRTGHGGYGMIPPMRPTTLLAAADSGFVIGFGDQLDVRTYAMDGVLRRIARGPTGGLDFTSDMRSTYQAAHLSGEDSTFRDLLRIAGNPMPKQVPAYTALIVDRVGNTWVRRFAVPGTPARRWGVFGADGHFLGHVKLPPGLDVSEIGADYVLGTTHDSLGVLQVHVFRLHKPEADSR